MVPRLLIGASPVTTPLCAKDPPLHAVSVATHLRYATSCTNLFIYPRSLLEQGWIYEVWLVGFILCGERHSSRLRPISWTWNDSSNGFYQQSKVFKSGGRPEHQRYVFEILPSSIVNL
ncbi:hypothetical protein VTN77DRAFT_6681 [Rasamsonia byssochlamydoides]|uniref:uncharacterized protein n=1 Tax=Rasamsonia byssochlamydoides TaxID=89139 RepID=UPI00374453F7